MGDDRDELESVVEYDQRVLNIAIQAAQDMLVARAPARPRRRPG